MHFLSVLCFIQHQAIKVTTDMLQPVGKKGTIIAIILLWNAVMLCDAYSHSGGGEYCAFLGSL